MKADLELIRKLSHGAATVTEKNGLFHFSRFTEKQRETYLNNPDFYRKTFATSGVSLEFETDAKSFSMEYHIESGSSRKFYFFDIFADEKRIAHHGNESYEENPDGLLKVQLNGEKHIKVYFPCLTAASVKNVTFEDATYVTSTQKSRKIICFGDSITQGYDAVYPSLSYPNQLADAFDAEMLNKGIGGELFNPSLLESADNINPELITVAYGTNDWGRSNSLSKEELNHNSGKFFELLTQLYPDAKIISILPIWRNDCDRITNAGTFDEAREIIRVQALKYNAVIIDGISLMPHDVSLFSDGYLHPNDAGFTEIGKNLIKELKSEF